MLAAGKISIDVTGQFKLRNIFAEDVFNCLWFKYIYLLNNAWLTEDSDQRMKLRVVIQSNYSI